jgi:hypothetical protein
MKKKFRVVKNFKIVKDPVLLIDTTEYIRAHLMSLGEDTEAFDSLKKLERIFIKKP